MRTSLQAYSETRAQPLSQTKFTEKNPHIERIFRQLLDDKIGINDAANSVHDLNARGPIEAYFKAYKEGNYCYIRVDAIRNHDKSTGIRLTLAKENYAPFGETGLNSINSHNLALAYVDNGNIKVSPVKDFHITRYKYGDGYLECGVVEFSTNECIKEPLPHLVQQLAKYRNIPRFVCIVETKN